VRYISLLSIPLLLAACNGQPERSDFLTNYEPYCGHAYRGESTLVELGDDHPLEDASLLMILNECSEDEVRIPFHVNNDRSRTWIVRETIRGLHLSHDHRHPDGTEYEANMYGGYADGEGSSTTQYFPADERTIRDRPAREINRWSKSFDHSAERYYYRLYLRDTLRYEARFDLSNPLPANMHDDEHAEES
jgi:hypothetical protein